MNSVCATQVSTGARDPTCHNVQDVTLQYKYTSIADLIVLWPDHPSKFISCRSLLDSPPCLSMRPQALRAEKPTE